MASIGQLLKHFSHFFGGNMLGLLLSLLTFPILTRLLTHEEYGVLALVNTTVAMVVALAKGGLSDGIIRFYRDYASDPTRLRVFTATVLTRALLLSAIVVALYLFFIPRVQTQLRIDASFAAAFTVMAVYLAVRPLNIVVLNYQRATGKTLLFNGTELAVRTLGIALSLGLLLWVTRDLTGYFVGIAVAEIIGSVILFRWLLSNYTFAPGNVSKDLTWSLARFGVPLLLTELSYLLLQSADRYILVAYHGEAVLGEYSVGYNIPAYINQLVMFPLSYAIVPLYTDMYAKEGVTHTQAFLNRVLNYYIGGILLLCAGYAAVAQDTIVLLASTTYAETASFSPIILVGLVFLGMNYILNAGLYLKKRTLHMLAIMLAAALLNIALNLMLIPYWGATGAAIATVVSCVGSTLLTCVLSFRYMPLRVDLYNIAYYSVWAAVVFVGVSAVAVQTPWAALFAKLAVGFILAAAAVIYREQQVRRLLLGRLRRRGS